MTAEQPFANPEAASGCQEFTEYLHRVKFGSPEWLAIGDQAELAVYERALSEHDALPADIPHRVAVQETIRQHRNDPDIGIEYRLAERRLQAEDGPFDRARKDMRAQSIAGGVQVSVKAGMWRINHHFGAWLRGVLELEAQVKVDGSLNALYEPRY